MNKQSQLVMTSVGSVFGMKEEDLDMEAFQTRLAIRIQELLEKDFARLINILYRLDVDEEKLKTQVANQPSNTSLLISRLIIERQLEKIKTRWQQSTIDSIPDEEKW